MIDRIDLAKMLEDKSISESKLPAEFKWICEKCLEGSGAHTCAWRGIDGKLCLELSQLLKNWKQLSTELEKQQKHGRWISVADRLPENEKPVLVSIIKVDYKGDKNNRISLAFHTDGNECSFNRKLDWEEGNVDLSWWEPVCHKDEFAPLYGRVTHWMPLPESPKQ